MPSTTSSVGLEALGLLDRDHAVLADLLHRVGDDLADLLSPLAEMVPTWAISFLTLTGLAQAWLELLDDAPRRPCRCRA
jgi:hypothetical protein